MLYPRISKVINGYKNSKGENVAGLGGNLRYFKTEFIDANYAAPSDRSKTKLTRHATEMLCIKEGTFDAVKKEKDFVIFKNADRYTGIIFDQRAIPAFKKAVADVKGKFSVYIFSLIDEPLDDVFAGMKQKIKVSPIPEAILKVYRKIFK